VTKDSWIYTAEYAMPQDEQLARDDRRIEMLDRVLNHAYSGRAAKTGFGWMASVRADTVVHNIDQAAILGRKLVDDANCQVSMPLAAMVSQQIVASNVFHVQLETLSLSEKIGVAEVCGELGITRQRLHQLRQSGRFPTPDGKLLSTPLWMRSTIREFTIGWRHTPGPAPRPMDMEGLVATGSMRWE
jgi:hypothetical protein